MSEEQNIAPENDKSHSDSHRDTNSKKDELKKESPAEKEPVTSDKQLASAEASANEPETISQSEPQPSNMETHAHHLHKAPGEGWKHYVFEFLMLFLAVFCGFLVENWREHIIESSREKQYIKSFYEDLTADEHDLQLNIDFLRKQMVQADSLQKLMTGITIKQPANLVYMYLRAITRSSVSMVHPNDRTIVQLRNAGGMRLIKNKSVSDRMVGYYRTAEIIQFITEEGIINRRVLREKYMPLLNAENFTKVIDSTNEIINVPEMLYLRKVDPDVINDCLIEIDRIKTLNLALAARIQLLKEQAGRIKTFINKEYRLNYD